MGKLHCLHIYYNAFFCVWKSFYKKIEKMTEYFSVIFYEMSMAKYKIFSK
jgi:hypothetical protein